MMGQTACTFSNRAPRNRHLNDELQPKQTDQIRRAASQCGVFKLAYQIVAVRENETVRYERTSILIAIAKARIWSTEGWQVYITDGEGRMLEAAEFEKLLAA